MSSKSGGRSESERRRDPEVLLRLWERQVARYGPELAPYAGDPGPGADFEGRSLSDEQLEAIRAQIDAAAGPGAADRLFSMWGGPLSEADRAALAEFPHFLTGTTVDDFTASHEQMRRTFGDFRAGAGDRWPDGRSEGPAGPEAERPTDQ